MIITLADFVATHALSNQIAPSKVTPAILDSLRLDLGPVLSATLLERLQELKPFTTSTWPVVLAEVTPGSYVVRRDRVYKALVNQPTDEQDVPEDGVSTTEWQYEPLRTLWLLYVKPYWLQAAYCRFLPTHGFNIEKAGLTTPIDPQGTYQPISAAHRAALQAAADNTAAALLNRLLRHLRADTAETPETDHACGHTFTHRRRRPIRGV